MFMGIGIAPEGSTPGVHRPLRQADRADLQAGAGDRALFRGHRLPGGQPGDRLRPPGRLGASGSAASRRSRGSLAPKFFGIPGAARVPGQPALARPALPREAGRVRGPDLAALRGAADAWSTSSWTRRASSRAWSTSTPTSSSTSPSSGSTLDRDKVADLGIEVDTVGRTLETLLGGRQVTRFKRNGKQYDVIVQIADLDRRNAGRPGLDLRPQSATASWCR